ncbi:MAG: LON peptidase substrate-binding domain-containing protein [Holosporales bacterium]|jgi:Lon protease-like protein|nr:LON peptidase substrate-binding domain-containing protein [Holosporales bacterium]
MFTINSNDLPDILPIMPLHGVILLPRSELQVPLADIGNFASVIFGGLKGSNYIGVVQVDDNDNEKNDEAIFRCGCVGKILDIQEFGDVGLVLSILGICRFEIEKEFDIDGTCRKAVVSYKKYESDIVEEADFELDRKKLISVLKTYFKKMNILPNWGEIKGTSNERLVTMLMMICPFDSNEKQALLETVGYTEQSKLITSIMEMDTASGISGSLSYH